MTKAMDKAQRDSMLTSHKQSADKYAGDVIVKIGHIQSMQLVIEYVKRIMGENCNAVWLRCKDLHTITRVLYDITDVMTADHANPQNIRKQEEMKQLSITPDEWDRNDLVLSFGHPSFHNVILQKITENTVIEIYVYQRDLVHLAPPCVDEIVERIAAGN
jgi:hypothetical protein